MTINNKKQFKTVIAFQGALILLCLLIGTGFWGSFCQFDLDQCISWQSPWSPISFGILAFLRPLLFTPTIILATLAGKTFEPMTAILLTALGAASSTLIPYMVGRYLGVNGVRPWMSANLPATYQLLKTQDYKIIFISRWLTFLPFDLSGLFFGMLGFRPLRTFIFSFLGVLPETYLFVTLVSQSAQSEALATLLNVSIFAIATLLPLFFYEFTQRKKGSSLWLLLKSTYYEIIYEIRSNNQIIRRRDYQSQKPTVILLYGFFSSRKALTIMERLLTQRGFQVMSFNLGGVLGVFFTKGIKETAEYIDMKIKRQIEKYDLKKVYIVGHSKGGLVGVWLLLKLGGAKYCKKIVTMGSPFNGSYLTYFGLFTPLGLLWRDLWQMRPASQFFRELHAAKIPEDLQIYCLHSKKDKVSGAHGRFAPKGQEDRIEGVAMDNIAHFEFLYKREVADVLAKLLRKEPAHKIPKTHENKEADG